MGQVGHLGTGDLEIRIQNAADLERPSLCWCAATREVDYAGPQCEGVRLAGLFTSFTRRSKPKLSGHRNAGYEKAISNGLTAIPHTGRILEFLLTLAVCIRVSFSDSTNPSGSASRKRMQPVMDELLLKINIGYTGKAW